MERTGFLSAIWITIIILLLNIGCMKPKLTDVERIIVEARDTMETELVEIIESDTTEYTVSSVADSIINVSTNDTVLTLFKDAIMQDSNYVGLLYSINFQDYKYSVIVRTYGNTCYVYPIANKIIREGQIFDPNDYSDMADEHSKEYGKEQLLVDLEESFDEFKNVFNEEISKRLFLTILRIKHLKLYEPVNQIQFPSR